MEEVFWHLYVYVGADNRSKGLPRPFLRYYLIIPNLGQYLGLCLKFSILCLALLKCVMLLSSFLLFVKVPLSCSSDLRRCADVTLFWAKCPRPFSQAAPDGSKPSGALLALFIARCLIFLGPNS